MLLFPDSERKYNALSVPYIDSGIEDLFASLLSIRRANVPGYTDESASDFGVQLMRMQAVLSRWMIDHMERIKNNLYIGTVQDRESARRILELLNYQLSEATAASVVATFTLEAGHPEFTIPKGTKISTRSTSGSQTIVFETSADQLVTAGLSSVNVPCVQGKTITSEILGSSDGSTGQVFTCQRRSVIWQSEMVEVFNGTWEEWTRVDNFVNSESSDKHYRVANGQNGFYQIIFGDGDRGAIPIRGTSNVRVTYRIGGGTRGNVGAGSLTELVSSVNYVESVTNAAAASGGMDRETIEHARIFGPGLTRTLERALNTTDIETICNAYVSADYGGIASSKAFESGGLLIKVMIVPLYGGLPSSGFKSELQAYLDARRAACMMIQVADPVYQYLDIDVTLHVHSHYASAEVAAAVKQRLFNYLSPTYQDPRTGLYPHGFGRNIYLSDIYAIVDGTPGVDYCSIDSPTSNQIVPEYQIADVGDLTITVAQDTGEQSYVDLRTDRGLNRNLT